MQLLNQSCNSSEVASGSEDVASDLTSSSGVDDKHRKTICSHMKAATCSNFQIA